MKNEIKMYIIGGLVTLAFIIGGAFLLQPRNEQSNTTSSASKEMIPVDSITHGHGLAVDIADPNKIYIATHHGLLVLVDEKDLYRVGNKQDDYMGFSPHPTNSKIFFSSGHPETGGNIGFQKSEDGGYTWKKVSDGVSGPVDFHAMAVSPVNPNLIYGWYQGAIQESTDGGNNWEIISKTTLPVVNLATDSMNEDIIYAASPQGLMVSNNKGKDWSKLFDGFVSVVAINPADPQKLLSYSEKNKLARSSDAGKTWETLNETFNGETPLFISFSKQNPENIYILTEKNSIYKTSTEGNSWSKIR